MINLAETFTDQDLLKYKGLKKVMDEGNYEIKGEAVITIASLFQWYRLMEPKIKASIAKGKIPVIKPLADPPKPKGKKK